MEPKRYSSGTGRLTADQLNAMSDATHRVLNPPTPWAEAIWSGPIPCRIESSTPMGEGHPNRWLYDLQAIDFDSITDSTQFRAVAQIRTDGNFAFNLAECANTNTISMGVDLNSLPSGWELKPIPDDAIVWAYFQTFIAVANSTDPNEQGFLAAFSMANHFDGDC